MSTQSSSDEVHSLQASFLCSQKLVRISSQDTSTATIDKAGKS